MNAPTVEVICGDALEELRKLPENSVDAVVTDPPYELGFMGKTWDNSGIAYRVEMWTEALRVLKPGGHMLTFGGTRTHHRMMCAIEDAGFEIRDVLMWLYGSGFPKSLDVSKAIDKAAGAERIAIGDRPYSSSRMDAGKGISGLRQAGSYAGEYEGQRINVPLTAPATPEAEQWEGWGTALKPAYEPIILARKPLTGTVIANVLEYGTGALNVDACRVQGGPTTLGGARRPSNVFNGFKSDGEEDYREHPSGRWPANILLDEEAAAQLDAQTGTLNSGMMRPTHTDAGRSVYGQDAKGGFTTMETYGDSGGASRFFLTVAQDDFSTYNVEKRSEQPCGEESTEGASTSAGRKTESSVDNSRTDGCGSSKTDQFPKDAKSTTETGTPSTTTYPISSAFPPNGTTTTTNDCESGTELLMGPSNDGVSDAMNTRHSMSSSDGVEEHTRATASTANANISKSGEQETESTTTHTCAPIESGNHNRFFYTAKASRSERGKTNTHPTVKPLSLMQWLVRLVTPPGGTVLDPFCGSGTTLRAAIAEGFSCIGIEREAEYVELIQRRITGVTMPLPFGEESA